MGNTFEDLIDALKKRNLELILKNKFLEILTKKKGELNWVDIENEYYSLLKESFKNQICSYKIAELNKDLSQIQKLLELYLENVEENFVLKFGNEISSGFFVIFLTKNIYLGRKQTELSAIF